MMRYLIVISLGLFMSGCISTNYEQLATQAGVRVSAVNSELAKISQSSRLAAGDRAHHIVVLEEVARKLQIEADREFDLRIALGINKYMLFVKTMLEAADKNANAITSLADSRDKMEADIQAQYQALAIHAQELSATAEGLGQLGTPRSGTAALAFLFQFAMDVNKAYADASKNAKTAQIATAIQTANKSNQQMIASTILTRDRALLPGGSTQGTSAVKSQQTGPPPDSIDKGDGGQGTTILDLQALQQQIESRTRRIPPRALY